MRSSTRVVSTVLAVALGLGTFVVGPAAAQEPPPSTGPTAAAPGPGIAPAAEPVPGRYLVQLREQPGEQPGEREREAATVAGLAATHDAQVLVRYEHVLDGFAAAMSEADAVALSRDPRVARVQEDGVVRASGTQHDPPSWGLDRIDQRALPLDGAYSAAEDGHGVSVYVIDTGIRPTHRELSGRASVGTDTVGDGGNGIDCNGHGTHVAATAAGGNFGVAKAAAVVGVRVLGCDGSGSDAGVIAGMDWVAANATGPAVANMSLGGQADPLTDEAVGRLTDAGVTVVVAAGNGDLLGRPRDACGESPAAAPEALTVAASDVADHPADFTNYGPCVDLFAPGVEITSATATSDTASATWDGTSMASPHVAGAAARYLSLDPQATPAQVTEAILGAATADVVQSPRAGTPNRLLHTSFALPTPSITTVVDAVPDAATDFGFELCPVAEGATCRAFTLDDDANRDRPNLDRALRLAPGTYTVTQVATPAGWVPGWVTCVGGDVTAGRGRATVVVGAGDAVTCTFREKTAGLTIAVDAEPNAARDFTFRRCGPAPGRCTDLRLDDDDDPTRSHQAVARRLAPGRYTITQGPAANWTLDELRCDRSARVELAARRAVVQLAANQHVTCTFTNRTTAISVVQDTEPDDPMTATYSLCRGAGTCRSATLDDDALDAARPDRVAWTGLRPGTYVLRQEASGDLADLRCDGAATVDLDARTATVTVAPGRRIRCTFTNDAPPPPNDDFADAQGITGTSGALSGTNRRATHEPGEPRHAGQGGAHSVWYRWTAPTSGTYRFDTCGSAFDTTLQAYTGPDLGSLVQEQANDDDLSCGLASRIDVAAVAGRTYHLAVDGFDQETGELLLNWEVAS